MTLERGWRSPRIAAVGATRIAGRPTANPMRPASAAPPRLKAYTMSASQPAHSTIVASRKPTSTRPSAPFRRRFAKTSASRLGLTLASGARWPGYVPVARPASVRVAGTAPSVGEGRVIPTPQDAGYRAGKRPQEVGESTPARNGDRGSAGNVRRHLGGDGQPDACEPRAP